MAPRRTDKFHMQLEPKVREMLDELSNNTGFAAAVIIRQLIRSAHAMTIYGNPTCASGQQCLCPQYHRPINPPTTPGPTRADDR